MSSMKVVGALLFAAVCISGASAYAVTDVTVTGCEDTAIVYVDGTDFYGNDITNGTYPTPQECVDACVADPACVALVYKTVTGNCYIKGSVDPAKITNIAGTGLSVDLRPCRGDGSGTDTPPAGTPGTNAGETPGTISNSTDGGWTFMTTVPVKDGKFVTTVVTHTAGATEPYTVESYYSSADGVKDETAPAFTTQPTVTIEPADGSYPTSATVDVMNDQGETVSTSVVAGADGALVVFGTVDPPLDAPAPGTTPPAPPATTGTDIALDATTNILAMNSTVAIAGTQPYVTIMSKLQTLNGTDAGTRAFYSDAMGMNVTAEDLAGAMTMAGGPGTDFPDASIVSMVPVPGQGNVTVIGVKGADGTYSTMSQFLPIGAVMPSPPSPAVTGSVSPPPGTTVPVSTPAPPRTSAALAFHVVGTLLSLAVFGVLML